MDELPLTEGATGGRGKNSLARLADFALWALPARPLQRSDGNVQTHAMVVQTAAGAEELVLELAGAVTQHAVGLLLSWEPPQENIQQRVREGVRSNRVCHIMERMGKTHGVA